MANSRPAGHLRLRRRVHGDPRQLQARASGIAFLAAFTLILGAAYTLWLVKRVMFGPVANDHVAALKDLNGREFLVLGRAAPAVMLLGVWPAPLLNIMQATVHHLVQPGRRQPSS